MRILMRSQMEHDRVFSPEDVILGNLMGGNCGNWLYQFSLYRTLITGPDDKIDILNFQKTLIDNKYIDFVNETYDCFVIPLANAFKTSFAWELRELTSLVQKLKIPCVVIGVGIQAKNTKIPFAQSYEDCEAASAFIKAVLEKSAMIGVRGEETGKFFSDLGFRPEKDFTIIGCPSMYMYGSHLPQTKPLDLSDEKLFLFNSKVEHENKKVAGILKGFVAEHPNYVFAPQRLADIIKCYYGMDFREQYIQGTSDNRFFDKSKTVCFSNVPSWISYIRENISLTIGTRLHGNVASVLSGTPSFILATDKRVEELAQYHNIPHTTIEKVNSPATIRQLVEKADFGMVMQGHSERFGHFVDFLEANGLKNAYSGNRAIEKVYFDSILENLDFSVDCRGFEAVSSSDKIARTQKAAVFYATRCNEAQTQVKEQTKKIKKLKKELRTAKKAVEQAESHQGFFSRLFK